jgi:hypothetical protein
MITRSRARTVAARRLAGRSRRGPPLRWLAVALAFGVIAAGSVIAGSRAGDASASTGGGRCAPRGHVLFAGPELTVWSASGGRVYSCVRASGEVRRIAHANAGAKGFVAAGHYLGFTYTTSRLGAYLDVFNAQRGSTVLDLNLRTGCGPINNACVQIVNAVQLAPSGWIAEVGPEGPLVATDGPHTTVQLDNGPALVATQRRQVNANGVSLSTGSTVSWTPGPDAGFYSMRLGPRLAVLDSAALEKGTVHPVAPPPGACALFTGAEAQAVLGAVTRVSSGDSCIYTTTTTPRSTLTLTLQPNLTAAQMLSAKESAYAQATSPQLIAPWPGPPDYGTYLWQVSWDSGAGGAAGAQSQAVQILGDSDLSVELMTKPTSSATNYQLGTSECWGPYRAVEHVSDIALIRLVGVPVSYGASSRSPSCVKANEGF